MTDDEARIYRAIDALIDSVKAKTIKPDRSWAGAMRALYKKLDRISQGERSGPGDR